MKKFNLATAALLSVALVGCSEEPVATGAFTPQAKKAATATTVTSTATVAQVSYSYSPIGKRDPFRSPAAELARSGPAQGVCAEPLCQWDLEQLSLVAVVTGDSNPLAMVQDPQGRGYLVRRNTKMGRQGGKISQILRNQLIVNEQFTDGTGAVVLNPVTLKIKDDSGMREQTMDFLTGKILP